MDFTNASIEKNGKFYNFNGSISEIKWIDRINKILNRQNGR